MMLVWLVENGNGPCGGFSSLCSGPTLLPERKSEGEKRPVTGSSLGGSAALLQGLHSGGRGRSFLCMDVKSGRGRSGLEAHSEQSSVSLIECLAHSDGST